MDATAEKTEETEEKVKTEKSVDAMMGVIRGHYVEKTEKHIVKIHHLWDTRFRVNMHDRDSFLIKESYFVQVTPDGIRVHGD